MAQEARNRFTQLHGHWLLFALLCESFASFAVQVLPDRLQREKNLPQRTQRIRKGAQRKNGQPSINARPGYCFFDGALRLAFALLLSAVIFSRFFTPLTPSTDLAIVSAFAICSLLATVPLKVTTAFSTSTLIVESRTSSAAARSKRVFVQSQPSSRP